VVRSAVAEVPAKGRDTMGVVFARAGGDDRIIAIARNSERGLEAQNPDDAEGAGPVETDTLAPNEAASQAESAPTTEEN